MNDFPADPTFSASLYADAHLDAAITGVLVRLASESAPPFYFIRYGLGGEHLKLRFFGTREEVPRLEERIQELARVFLDGLPPPEESVATTSMPPIDPEDEDLSTLRQRCLVPTTYQRSYVPFAGPPFLEDDLLMACASRVYCRLRQPILGLFAEAPPAYKTRQSCLMRIVAFAVGAFGVPTSEQATYLAYHSGWLCRWLLGATQPDQQDRLLPLLQKFDQLSAAQATSFPALRSYFAAGTRHFENSLTDSLREDFAAFGDRARQLAANAKPEVDPFTTDLSYLPLFKSLHMAANALGIRMRDEAFVHHLLGAALTAAR